MYKLILQKSARKELDKIPDPFFVKIDKAILSLRENPYPFPQSRKLKGEDMHRLRVGDYQVVYDLSYPTPQGRLQVMQDDSRKFSALPTARPLNT